MWYFTGLVETNKQTIICGHWVFEIRAFLLYLVGFHHRFSSILYGLQILVSLFILSGVWVISPLGLLAVAPSSLIVWA